MFLLNFCAARDSGLLLATDVAARGLDIAMVARVVHYQVPRTVEVGLQGALAFINVFLLFSIKTLIFFD